MESLINDVGLDPTEYSWAKIKRNGVTVDFVNMLLGASKVMLAHSLGNMLV